MNSSFDQFFQTATREPSPFPYQVRFAEDDSLPDLLSRTYRSWQDGDGNSRVALAPIPPREAERMRCRHCAGWCITCRCGCWLSKPATKAQKWLKNLGLEDKVKVHVLMGGEDVEEWDLEPENPAVLIGTQDMLLSRALNRGYGIGRFRWPMHFGLLNNDCLWVLDEIQLMGTGLATSTQLQAFRESLGAFGAVKTVWMSATLLPRWLASVDFRDRIEPELRLSELELDPEKDYQADGLRERWNAAKPLSAVNLTADDTAAVAQFVRDNHIPGSLTLVIVNRVDRSRKLFEAIRGLYAPPTPRGAGGMPRRARERQPQT